MKIGADEKVQIARLLSFLLRGEQLAQACAVRQARITDDRLMRRFFVGQSRQEEAHAKAFKTAILWLAPKGVTCPALAVINQYESVLNDALMGGDLMETLLGMQIVLEGMGHVVLSHFNNGIEGRGMRFIRLRRAFLTQEASHHAFGIKQLECQINKPEYPANQLLDKAGDYLALIHNALNRLHGLFEYFNEDSKVYLEEFQQQLPHWMNMNAFDSHTSS